MTSDANDPRLGYEAIEQEFERVPTTWLPGLLFKLVTVCVRQRIFQDGGLNLTVQRAKQKAEREYAVDTNATGP